MKDNNRSVYSVDHDWLDDGQIVADGLTMEILEDEASLSTYGLEKP
jgi:hypothetical protein